MKEKKNKIFPVWLTVVITIVIAFLIAFLFRNVRVFQDFWGTIKAIFRPFVYGFVFVFLLAPLYNYLCAKKINKYISAIVCVIIVLLAFFLFGWLLVPQLVTSIKQVIDTLPDYGNRLKEFLAGMGVSNQDVEIVIDAYTRDLNSTITIWLSEEMLPNIRQYAMTLSSGVISVLTVFKDVFIGFIIMFYLLLMKTQFKAQIKKLCYCLFSVGTANSISEEGRFAKEIFSKFIVGKIIDSLIIGVLTFIVLTIFKVPYTVLIAVIVGITNIIPYFGPFIGAIPCAFLLLLISPLECLKFVIIIIIIQQLDGNVIGPKILGQATGVSSFWVLTAILIFGGLFGVVGMIIAVPAFAVIMRLLKKNVGHALKDKSLSADTAEYVNLDYIDETTLDFIKHSDDKPEKDGKSEEKRKG